MDGLKEEEHKPGLSLVAWTEKMKKHHFLWKPTYWPEEKYNTVK